MSGKVQQILLTGPPGIGKTTVVKKICDELRGKNINISGFYTEEVRNGRQRVGFDVVTLDGKSGPLARVSVHYDSKQLEAMPKVGQYAVELKSFESLALPSISLKSPGILVLDEVGKMEMFSELFKQEVIKAFRGKNKILGTIPLPKGRPLPFIENLKKGPNVKIIEVTRENRNSLPGEIAVSLLGMGT